MKQNLIIAIILIMLTLLVGCTSEEAQNVIAKIDSIGEITFETGNKLNEIAQEYELLQDDEKEQVENYNDYETAVEKYNSYMKSTVDDVAEELSYYQYGEQSLKAEKLFLYYDYMNDEQKRECMARYRYYEEVPNAVNEKIKNALQNPSSYKLYDMDISSVISYNDEKDEFTGFIDVTFGGTNAFGGMVKDTEKVWVDFSVDIETTDLYIEEITIWGL